LLKPQSIAIVSFAEYFSRIGENLLKTLVNQGYRRTIFPVNVGHEEVDGIRCYPSLSDIHSEIDAVLVAVPEEAVPQVIEEAGRKKVKSAIIYPSGLSEQGVEAGSSQEQIAATANKYDLLICGPNSAGIVNFHDNIALSFSQILDLPQLIPGNIAFVSQSSSLGETLINRAQDKGIGISYFISTGNEAVLESSDYIEYLLHDSHTSVIIWLMKGIKNADKFLRVADLALEKKKPIVVMKVGSTALGRKESSFHTGSKTGSDPVYEAIFRQKGMIRVAEPDELYDTASMLAKNSFPKGNRIGIITNTIGGAVILLDKLSELGMVIPELTYETVQELSNTANTFSLARNPLNLTSQIINDALIFPKSLGLFTRDKNLDAVIVAISMVEGEQSKEMVSHIIKTAELLKKPTVIWWLGGSLSGQGIQMLKESSVPFFTSPDHCAKALEASFRYSQFLESHGDGRAACISISSSFRRRIELILENSEHILTEDQGKEILSACGISVPSEKLSKSPVEAKKIANEIGYPVALKIISPQIVHKTEAGVLELEIGNERELSLAYRRVLDNAKKYNPRAEIKGVLVQEMVKPGVEVIVGVVQDAQFGPMVMFGLGGIFVEVLRDFSLRHAPFKERDAWSMIREIKGYPVLEGVRGGSPCDLSAIVRVLMSVSQLAIDFQDFISSMDINPLVVYPEGGGVKALDCLFVKKNGE